MVGRSVDGLAATCGADFAGLASFAGFDAAAGLFADVAFVAWEFFFVRSLFEAREGLRALGNAAGGPSLDARELWARDLGVFEFAVFLLLA